jgi:hypothetical protein
MNTFSFQDLRQFASEIYQGRPVVMTPYGYTVTFTGLAQNAQASQQLSITANADFILTEICYRPAIGAAQTVSNKTAAFVRLLITDSGTNEQYTNSAVDLENFATNGGIGRVLPYPRWIGGRTSLTFQAFNYAPTAETYTFDVYLSGVLVRAR